jgi:hypothetical protein
MAKAIPTRMNARKRRLPNEGRTAIGSCAVIATINFLTQCDGLFVQHSVLCFRRQLFFGTGDGCD